MWVLKVIIFVLKILTICFLPNNFSWGKRKKGKVTVVFRVSWFNWTKWMLHIINYVEERLGRLVQFLWGPLLMWFYFQNTFLVPCSIVWLFSSSCEQFSIPLVINSVALLFQRSKSLFEDEDVLFGTTEESPSVNIFSKSPPAPAQVGMLSISAANCLLKYFLIYKCMACLLTAKWTL